MSATANMFSRALSQAREEWLLGDPSAWSRYTSCLARMEEHTRFSAQKPQEQPKRKSGGWNPLSTPSISA